MTAAIMRQLPQMPPQLNGEAPSLPEKLHSVDLGRYEQVGRPFTAGCTAYGRKAAQLSDALLLHQHAATGS